MNVLLRLGHSSILCLLQVMILLITGIDFVKVIFNVDGARVRLQIWLESCNHLLLI